MTLKEFIEKYRGKHIDFDGIYPNQCMDLMHFYVYEVLEIKDKAVLATPSAHQIFTGFKWGTLFDKVENTPHSIPEPGDIIIWGTSVGKHGHVAMFVSGSVNNFKSFDANWPTGTLPKIVEHSYNGVLGWLRSKTSDSHDEKDLKIKALEEELKKMRKSRDGWRKACGEFEKDLKDEKDANEILLTQVNSLKADLARFNKDVITFKLLNKQIEVRITPVKRVPKGVLVMAKDMVQEGKALIKSRVFWFNVLAGVVAVASLFGFGEFESSPEVTQGISTVVAIVNIVLRLKTKEPIDRIK